MRTFALVIFLFILGLILLRWQTDIRNDRSFTITTQKQAEAYNDWQCKSSKDDDCKRVFEVKRDIAYPVQRIRMGQGTMSIKIVQDGVEGWMIYDRNVMLLVKKP